MGTWLVEELLARGARVMIPRRPAQEGSRFDREGLERRCHLLQLDLSDLSSALRVINELDVEVVFHLASQTIVDTANKSPLQTFAANVRGTYTLLEACRLRGKPPRVVVASSYHAYGSQPRAQRSEQ